MHQPKREYNHLPISKREEKPKVKTICCVSCGKVLAAGNIQRGTLDIDCRHCGTKNVITAESKHDEG